MKRYVLEADKYLIEDHYKVQSDSDAFFKPNYNVMPGTNMPIIIAGDDGRQVVNSRWGLQLKDQKEEYPSVKQEEILEREEFAKLVTKSPCIIPASGFYKWKKSVEDPLPFYIRVISNEITSFAGFYTKWKNKEGRIVHSYSVLTMPANPLVQPLDERMPCILLENQYQSWLSGEGKSIIRKGFSSEELLVDMAVVRVPELVNDPSNNSKELIQPIPKLRNYDMEDED